MRPVQLLIFAVISVFQAGCANHPLVDDFTGYSTYDVMHKVRCEARGAVHAYYHKHDFARVQREQDQLERELSALQSKSAALAGKLKEERDANTAREQDWDRLRTKKLELIRLVRALEKYLDDLLVQAQRDAGGSAQETLQRTLDKTTDRVAAVKEEAMLLAKLLDQLALDRAPMLKLEGDVAVAQAALRPIQSRLRSKEIEKLERFNRTTMASEFQFQITENNKALADGTIVWPVPLGTITLGLSAGEDKKRESDRYVKVAGEFETLYKVDCSDARLSDGSPGAQKYPVTGNIGVAEFVEQYFKVSENAEIKGADKTFIETLKFTTLIKKGLKPSVALAPVNPNSIKATLDLNADRTDLHLVTVAIKPGTVSAGSAAMAAAAATKIQIGEVQEINLRVARDPLDTYLRGHRETVRP